MQSIFRTGKPHRSRTLICDTTAQPLDILQFYQMIKEEAASREMEVLLIHLIWLPRSGSFACVKTDGSRGRRKKKKKDTLGVKGKPVYAYK